MKNLFTCLFLFLLVSFHIVIAQTTLSAGDLIIPTVNADGDKNFDFVPLVNLESGTVINFTDNAWISSSSSLATNEGTLTYTATSSISAGTIVSCPSNNGGDGFTENGNFLPSASGDNILVYQGTASSPYFIYGIGWAKTNSWVYTGTNDSDIPPALSEVSCTIVNLGADDNYQYNTANGTSGNNAEILALLTSVSNYNNNNDPAYSALSATFTISGSGFSIKGPTSSGELVLTEINDPTDSDFSYLEIYNTSSDYMNILECSAIQYSAPKTTEFSSSEDKLSITRRSGANIKLDGGILIAPKNFLLLIRGDNTIVSVPNFESSSYYNRTLNDNVLFAWDGTDQGGVPLITGDETFEITNSSGTTIDKSAVNVDSLIKVNGSNETFAIDKRYERIGVSSYDWVKYTGDYNNATPGSISSDNQNDSSLPVSLQNFNAVPGNSKITLCWVTESETDNLGFNLYRSTAKDGGFVVINDQLIPGYGSTSAMHKYSYVDRNVVNGITYYYKIEDVDYAGKSKLHHIVVSATPAGNEASTLVKDFRLHPCFPNPFNPETTLRFELGETADVHVQVYDLLGNMITTLTNSTYQPGEYSLTWDGVNFQNQSVATGIYFVHTQTSTGFSHTDKVVYIH